MAAGQAGTSDGLPGASDPVGGLAPLGRRWTICLVHHAHTDLGYTDSPAVVRRRHLRHLDDALALVARKRRGEPDLAGFAWTAECFWAVDQWLREASPERRAELAAAAAAGDVGLSGTYLHFTELADERLLRWSVARGAAFARSIGVPMDTAVSADINGFSWGYAQALHDAGIQNLHVCLHAHHGMAPVGRRQAPFFWVTPDGGEILVWLNEHYMFGNMLGLAPRALLTYGFTDEFHARPASADNWPVAEVRVRRYLGKLEADGYPADFVPVHVSGRASDNAPPSADIARFANQWNERHGDSVRIEFATPSAVSRRIRQAFRDIPRHRGDWPDWWSDGVASVPAATRRCRQAQRDLRFLEALALRNRGAVPPAAAEAIAESLALYCEHTFGHAASVLAPWDAACQEVAAAKAAHAARACELTAEALDAAGGALGPGTPAAAPHGLFRVVNPLEVAVRDVCRLALAPGDPLVGATPAVVVDRETGRELPHQSAASPVGSSLDVRVDLAPGEGAELEVREGRPTLSHRGRHATEAAQPGTEGLDVAGSEPAGALAAAPDRLESPFVRIAVEPARGIVSWVDRETGAELLLPGAAHCPFQPVHDVTPVTPRHDDAPDMGRNANIACRGRMGLNRKGPDAVQCEGRLTSAAALEGGPLRATLQLDYAVAGCEMYRVRVSAWADLPRVDVVVRLLKQAVWEPENLYVALPFTCGAGYGCELWLDKAGAVIRPGRDQLPDSLTDYYCVQAGMILQGRGRGLVVALPDAPLVQLGPLAFGTRLLAGAPALEGRSPEPYSWLMTNYWETNFEASLGGFHEFRYRVEWGGHIRSPREGAALCQALAHGMRAFRAAADQA